ncbi:MAG: ComF family protein [Lentisphaeraceae bacterium]|nr:ComF family protein [Lentisphaeraceae bacterium]
MKNLRKYIFPEVCTLCYKNSPDQDKFLCIECIKEVIHTQTDSCPLCSSDSIGLLDVCHQCIDLKRPWTSGGAPLKFESLTREIIHKFKYNSNLAISRYLIDEMAEFIENKDFPEFSLITMVPLHWYKQITRGFNQAEILAEGISQKTGVPCRKVLKKRRSASAQALKNRRQRQKNITHIFDVPEKQKLPNGAILLIDDVMTTGATLAACTEALTNAGAESVYVLTAARG